VAVGGASSSARRVALAGRVVSRRLGLEAREPKGSLLRPALQGLEAPGAEVRKAERPCQKPSGAGGPLIGCAPVLPLTVLQAARPECHADLELQRGTRPRGGTAATAAPHRGQDVGQDDGRAILEGDRCEALQEGNGDWISGYHPPDGALEDLG
jgi:hypothetical protein